MNVDKQIKSGVDMIIKFTVYHNSLGTGRDGFQRELLET
jgi:hypothetical protein